MINFPARPLALLRFAAWLATTFLLGGLTLAQTTRITGAVTDNTGAAIPGAKVVLSSAGFQATQITDSRGRFSFEHVPVQQGTTQASAAGFLTRKLQWSAGQGELKFELAPAGAAEEVTVTANRASTRVIDTPTSVVVLSPQDIAATAALTTDDKLRQAAGFSLFRRSSSRTANPTSQGVSLRGLGASGASRALVLLQGVPLNDPFGGWVYWDRVPTTDIQAVEILRGGGSSLYGSGAVAGVISVLPREVEDRAFAMDLSGGGQDTGNGSATVSERVGAWALGASAQAMRTDGYIPIPESLRGRADAPANVRFGTGHVVVQRDFSKVRLISSGNLFNES